MGKNAAPKVAIDAKNHMENHTLLSVSVLPCIIVSILCVNFGVIVFTAKVYKFFH
jgi:hypothetical protein